MFVKKFLVKSKLNYSLIEKCFVHAFKHWDKNLLHKKFNQKIYILHSTFQKLFVNNMNENRTANGNIFQREQNLHRQCLKNLHSFSHSLFWISLHLNSTTINEKQFHLEAHITRHSITFSIEKSLWISWISDKKKQQSLHVLGTLMNRYSCSRRTKAIFPELNSTHFF